ncbi:hypothetical protein HYT45_03360 [Candidatus Uhrbacteria bacterium]|nr:hypothetical protein [Candidatus Uhrbacteria bacterium]
MLKTKGAIAIIGPTGVGKTSVAFALARQLGNGEVINLDKIYLFKHFPISSGLSDTLKEKDVKKHLYELLEPDEDIIDPIKYSEMVIDKCLEIIKSGGVPIIEGGSTTYFSDFYRLNRQMKVCKIIGLKFPSNFDIEKKISQRVELAFKEGLLEEIAQNLKKYRDTLVMQDGHAVVPLVSYLDKEIDFETAKQKILERCLRYINRQMELFTGYKDIIWIEHESKLLAQTIEKIIDLVK